MPVSSPIDHRFHSPAEAGSSSIHRSQAEARSHIPASLIDRAFVVPFLPTPFENGTSYVNNVAKDREHEVQRNSASGAKSDE